MTQDKENKEPSTIVFHNSNVDWVMRITADRRIEVNERVEVTEAAQKVLDALQQLLKAQRTWVGLTVEEIEAIGESYEEKDRSIHAWGLFACDIQSKLKEKNT